MGAEVYALMDAFDSAFMLWNDLEAVMGQMVHIMMMKDYRQLFDAETCCRRTTERRLGTDISAARQSYRRYEMTTIVFVSGGDNPADGLTKANGNESLSRIMNTG